MDMTAFKNMKSGDILWVSVQPHNEHMIENVRDQLLQLTEDGIGVFVTPTDVVSRVHLMSLVELCHVRDLVEQMITMKYQGQMVQGEEN